jgi:hypothetical protein
MSEDWREDGDRLASAEITARDAFAMAALQGMTSNATWLHVRITDSSGPANAAKDAYAFADAMLRARLTRP